MVPPSQQSRAPGTVGRSSDSRADVVAFSRHAPRHPGGEKRNGIDDNGRPARSQRRGRPGFAPEFPVEPPVASCDGGDTNVWGTSVGERQTLSTKPDRVITTVTLSQPGGRRREAVPVGWSVRVKLCRLEGLRPQILPLRNSVQSQPKSHHKSLKPRNLQHTQAAFPSCPIPQVSPGASLCPSGNQGATATCHESSHGMARQACRGKVRGSLLGVT